MSTLEIKAAFPDLSEKRVANIFDFKEKQALQRERAGENADIFRSVNTNDAVAAKVLSFSISQRFETSFAAKSIETSIKANKLHVIDNSLGFNIDTVVENVLGFVTSALTELSRNGASSDDLSYFKKQALDGVNVGVEQAKAELSKLKDDTLTKNIEISRTRILEGIDNLPSQASEYLKGNAVVPEEPLKEFRILTKGGKPIDITFGSTAFINESTSTHQQQLFTTQASNLSFSVAGDLSKEEFNALADVVNRADDLTNTFYRKNIEQIYDKAKRAGYEDASLLNLSSQSKVNYKNNIVNVYEDIKHFQEHAKLEDVSSPKAVAQYLSRLINVLDASERELASKQEYKQLINGLVNQMKDVQVPDLVQAINRFHEFNAKFIAIE